MAAPLRVLVVGEGRSEIGDLDALVTSGGRRTKRPIEGFIPPLVRRMLGGVVKIDAQKVTILGRYQAEAKLPGHGDRAARALSLAAAQGYDVLVFVKDVDRLGGTKKSDLERRRKLRSVNEEIEAGFAGVKDADHVVRVKGTPCRMIEAWALGDAAAVASVADVAAADQKCPRRPESLWGDEADLESDHPKCVLRRVLGRQPSAEALEEIAMTANIAAIREACPDSFSPFAVELKSASERLSGSEGTATDDEGATRESRRARRPSRR